VFYDQKVAPEELYTLEYFKGREYRDYEADKDALQRNFNHRIAQLRKLKPSGRLLELGSAYGFFLELAGCYWQVKGIDIALEAARYARESLGLDVISGDFLSVPDEPESFDLICMWDTIEHLTQPVRVIERAARWLRPGGILAMTTGDIDSLLARLQRKKWRLIHPPTHLFYFSPATLGQAVEGAGLKLLEISHVGYCRSYQAMLHGLLAVERERPSLLRNLLGVGGRLDFAICLNLFDIMMLVAGKPEGPSPRGDAD
jgi:SAM-dependent methyltransferase